MAYVDLDKIINIESGGWGVYPWWEDPAPYPVLSQSIGIFNKPDAWDWDSNGWFGLLNNSNNAVNAQNMNWNNQVALAVDSWIGALSTRIKSFDFSQNIWQVDWGQIRFGVFRSWWHDIIHINETSNQIKKLSKSSVNLTYEWRLYIITSWWNKFICTNWNIYPMDINYNITWSSVWTYLWTIIWTVWNNIWTLLVHSDWDQYWAIFSINSSWVATEVNRAKVNDTNTYWTPFSTHSYQLDSTISHVLAWMYSTPSQYLHGRYITVDLTNTSIFTFTTIYDTLWWNLAGNVYWVWYDWSWLLFLMTWSPTTIYKVTWSWITWEWIYHWYSTHLRWALNYFTNLNDSISSDWTILKIYWNNVNWDSVWWIWYIYEITSWSEDDSFIWIILDNSKNAFGEDNQISLNINWNNVLNWISYIFNNWPMVHSLWIIQINSKYLEVSLNTNSVSELKLALWATWGTYATPTLPISNGMTSGSAASPWVPWTDASYINLTLAS